MTKKTSIAHLNCKHTFDHKDVLHHFKNVTFCSSALCSSWYYSYFSQLFLCTFSYFFVYLFLISRNSYIFFHDFFLSLQVSSIYYSLFTYTLLTYCSFHIFASPFASSFCYVSSVFQEILFNLIGFLLQFFYNID